MLDPVASYRVAKAMFDDLQREALRVRYPLDSSDADSLVDAFQGPAQPGRFRSICLSWRRGLTLCPRTES